MSDLGGFDEIGGYVLLDLHAQGGMSLVYVAWRRELDQRVALKVPKDGALPKELDAEVLRNEAQTLASLDHVNIARLYDAGIDRGKPFLALELLSEGTLAASEHRDRYRTPLQALGLVRLLARAMEHAHGRDVLHCDLKPENVLFDEEHVPHISDFGLARRWDWGHAGVKLRGGTPGWMAPEQAGAGAARSPVRATADVFSLGMLLHWLVSSELPFGEGADYARRAARDPRPDPGPWSPSRHWALQAICAKALRAEPNERFQSMTEFAAELERAIRHEPLLSRQTPYWGRGLLFVMRHPSIALAGFLLLLLAVVSAGVGVRALAEQERGLRRGVLEMNAYAASGHAAAVMYHLRDEAAELRKHAENADVIALALSTTPYGPTRPPPLEPWPANYNPCDEQLEVSDSDVLTRVRGGFDMLNVLDTRGCGRARIGLPPPGYEKMYFGWRDYYQGAKSFGQRSLRSVYVGKLFRSYVTAEIRYSMSTPLFDDRAQWVGVLAAGVTVDTTSTLPAIRRVQTDNRMTALLGRYESDRDPMQLAGSDEYVVLAHPLLERGAERLIPSEYGHVLRERFGDPNVAVDQFALSTSEPMQIDGYTDPLTSGRWLAAFAPVGGTGYVILVQTREDAAVSPSAVLLRQLAYWFVGLGSLGLVIFGAFAAWIVRRGRERPLH